MKLFPQLPDAVAREMARQYGEADLALLTTVAGTRHEAVTYSPTGGTRVTEAELEAIRVDLLSLAVASGFPGTATDASRRTFDAASATMLFDRMDITASEASNPRIWSFLGCILGPDADFTGFGHPVSREMASLFRRKWPACFTGNGHPS